jgi:transcriptional regulator with XRE-family HTH domain
MALQPKTDFARWLHAFRKDGESERAFARRLGIEQQTLRRIYEGHVSHQSTLISIATAIKIPPEEVFRRASTAEETDQLNSPAWLVSRIVDALQGLSETNLAQVLTYVLNLLAKQKQ